MRAVIRSCCAALAGVMTLSSAPADWQVELQKKLTDAYPLVIFKGARITNPENVYLLKQDGILAGPANTFTNIYNRVDDGNILRQTGGGNARVLKAGEKIWLDELRVRGNDIQFHVITTTTADAIVGGSTTSQYHKAMVTFFFPKGALERTSFEDVQKLISKVFVSEKAASAPKTVSLGQTPEQVEAVLGPPSTKINLGSKLTYVYKDLKVIFQDGKVADVQ